MLQPRRRIFGYLQVCCIFGLVGYVCAETGDSDFLLKETYRNGERIRRDDGDVTILSLEENAKVVPELGLLSTTARTFVNGGTTTEFATQVLGTTLGRTYARLLSTGSRVFYDNSRPSRDRIRPTDAYLVFPTALPRFETTVQKTSYGDGKSGGLSQTAINIAKVVDYVEPSQIIDIPDVPEVISNDEPYKKLTLDDLFDLSDSKRVTNIATSDDRENVVSVRKEYSVKRNSNEVKPAKVVKPDNDLPTFTVRHEFAPSGFSVDEVEEEKKEEIKPGKRNGKALFRGGIQLKQEKKLESVTYFGFADFTTTVGDTVIVFMPKTPDAHPQGSITSITGDATLRPEDGTMPVVTSVKTFMSHSPGMATRTVTGHSLSMHTTLPTVLVDPILRESKAYEPVFIPELEPTEIENVPTVEPSTPSFDYSEIIEPSIEPISTEIKSDATVVETEPLSTYATTLTQIYNADEEALGLVKSIGGTEAFNGTTTVFTSYIFGTIIDGTYKQLIQSASSVFIDVGDGTITTTGVGIGIAPSSVEASLPVSEIDGTTESEMEIPTTEEKEPQTHQTTAEHTTNEAPLFTSPDEITTQESDLLNEVDARKIDAQSIDNYNKPVEETSSIDYITRIIPTTTYKTFTYLTTFFIPDGTETTTSIRSREVTSEEINYETKLVNPNLEVTDLETTIVPTEAVNDVFLQTTTPEEIPAPTTEESNIGLTTSQIPVITTTTEKEITTTTEKDKEPRIVTTTEKETRTSTTEKETRTSTTEKKTITSTTEKELPTTTENDETTEITTLTPTTTNPNEKEVELIFKTLYTTYTYLTTFFQESTTSVSSSEVVVTNVITTTLDNKFLEASDPAVAGLFAREDSLVTSYPSASDFNKDEIAPTSVGIGRPTTKYFEDTTVQDDLFVSTIESVDIEKELATSTPTLDLAINEISDNGFKTFYTTYTYFTTIFVDGETEVESRTEVYTNVVTPTPLLEIETTSAVSDLFISSSVVPDIVDQMESPQDITDDKIHKSPLTYASISRAKATTPQSEALFSSPDVIATSIDDAYKYDTTMSRNHNVDTTQVVDDITSLESDTTARDMELSKEEKLLIGVTPANDDTEVFETMVVDVTSSTSGGGSRKVYRESDFDPDDQITSESNTEEIEPSFSPTLLLQTSYTTFTYFTTMYKGTTSDVVSRLETVTNVVTETLKPSDIEASLNSEEASLPVTYFTTFTYWTTLYKDGNTMVTSREETVSNVVTPTITTTETTPSVEITPTSSELILPTLRTEVVGITEIEPTTFYTTYTYFTTSYINNSTIVNSRLETVTEVVTPTPNVTGTDGVANVSESIQPTIESSLETMSVISTLESTNSKPTGLLSTIRTSEVNSGITTLLSTDVYGTYIDGLYAQILESSTQIVTPSVSSSTVQLANTQPTGIVSINEGKIVDADGVSTTFFTTKAIGTIIDQLYAQVIESTTSIKVDEEKKTAQLTGDPSTTVVGTKSFRTGLVRLIEGSMIKDKTTTFYESRVIGTLIDGRYAQIIESTSSFKVEMTSTPVPVLDISPTSTVATNNVIIPTISTTTSPSPAVIESSLSEDESGQDENEENEEDEDDDQSSGRGRVKSRLSFSSRKKTFTPVIRPFASRPRPTFLPKKKTGALESATTITRAAFTPTITATPALKSNERGSFGSSRNRFAGGRRSSSSSVAPSSSSSSGRRFSRPRGSSTPALNQSSFRGRSSTGRTAPTVSVSGSRRGGFNYRTSIGGRASSDYQGRSSVAGSNSRFRIRPTASSGFGRAPQSTTTTSTTTEDIFNTNDIGGTTVVTEETLFTSADEEQETVPPSTTTESPRRNNNPLLRFRRPPILQRTTTTTTTSKPQTTSARRNPLLRRPDNRGAPTTPITPTRNRPAPSFNRVRTRPSNSLFPPRGLVKKPSPAEEAEENEEKEEDIEEDNENGEERQEEEENVEDNEYEGSENSESQQSTTTTTEATKTNRRGKLYNPVQIKPFGGLRRPRTKRQVTEYGTRSFRPRFQRPTKSPPPVEVEEPDPTPSEPPPRPGRFTPRSRTQSQPRVRPTTVSSASARSQFTLRDKSPSNSRSNFRRPTTASPRRRTSNTDTTIQRPKPPRLRTKNTQSAKQTKTQDSTTSTRSNGRRYSSNSRSRPSSRSRNREHTDFDSYTYSQSSFDGTITVTHQIPTEVSIPIVNGKVTEYKNIITAKPSLEVLGPHQYTTTLGKDGNPTIQLTSEITGTLPNGAMEVTRFIVYETPTTSIIFTPTTLRGRKTSFSHVIPSTVYEVKQEVSTVQPQLAANAPLANLLLSQLLLGNLNFQQQTVNPLLALNNQQAAPPTPTTEFKTKTTTYVTTITDHTSTVIPLTFRGKEIFTTLIDSSTQVITATEYITETIIVTPTAANNQLNSLLLPALLQAQLLQPQQPTINPLLGNPLLQQQQPLISQDILGLQDEKLVIDDEPVEEKFLSRRKPAEIEEERPARESEVIEEQKPEPKITRKKPKIKGSNKKPPDVPVNPAETSVVTLYISGRRPGDFSTVLSTVTLGEESSVIVRKREAGPEYPEIEKHKMEASRLPEIGSSFPAPGDEGYLNYLMPALNEVAIEGNEAETQSLESFLGGVSKYISMDEVSMPTDRIEYIRTSFSTNDPSVEDFVAASKTNKKVTGHFLSKGPAELAPHQRTVETFKNWSNLSLSTLNINEDGLLGFETDGVKRRVKRQTEEVVQPVKRRRVRVRVPIQKRVFIDEDLTPLEAQRSHEVTQQGVNLEESNSKYAQIQDFGTRKIKIIRKKPKNFDETVDGSDVPRKRVAVRRRRPISSLNISPPEVAFSTITNEDSFFQVEQSQTLDESEYDVPQYTAPTQKRKRIRVTKKRIIMPTVSIEPTHRRRVIITKKRPIVKDIVPSSTDLNEFIHEMKTVYDLKYSIPMEDNPGEMVTVSNVFMSGNIPDDYQIKSPKIETDDETENVEKGVISEDIETSEIEDTETYSSPIPKETQSLIWFYEPTDSMVVDVAPTSVILKEPENTVSFNNEMNDTTVFTIEPSIELNITDLEKMMNVTDGLLIDLTNTTNSSIVETETSQYDGPPRFVRPTRFSITRKPVKTATGYPGSRRRKPAVVPTFSSSSTVPSYRNKNKKNKYSKSEAEYSSDLVEDIINHPEDIKPSLTEIKVTNLPDLATSVPSVLFENIPNLPELASSIDPVLPDAEETLVTFSSDTLFTETETNLKPTYEPVFITTTVTSTRLRTYTYVVTRVSGDEQIITSSTSVKPQVKTLTLTLPASQQSQTANPEEEGRGLHLGEARFNLATKIMSNGVEVIVAGGKSTLPGAPDVLRVLPTSLSRPITLAPSTLTDHMMMLLPQGNQDLQEFVTKTYLTTYTYLTTLLQDSSTVVSSNEKIVSNVVTEEVGQNKATVTPTPVTQVTLTASPSLATGVFHTTYTYLNTLIDGEVPLVVTSKKTVANTVTAPEDYMMLLQPSETGMLDTNTYFSTVAFTKTLSDGPDLKVVSTEDILTQVIITESDNKISSLDIQPTQLTANVVKTYFVTYTYYSTMVDGEDTVVHSEVATSSDVVTEKFILPPKRTSSTSEKYSEEIKSTEAPTLQTDSDNPINVFATKTYLTTFTYFTTLLQDKEGQTPSTVINSRTRVVQNIVTETLDTSLLHSDYLSSLRSSLQNDNSPIVATATLNDGQKMEITAMGETLVQPTALPGELSSSFEEINTVNNNIVTGSTIIFFDENDQIDSTPPTTKTSQTKPTSDSILTETVTETVTDSSLALPLTVSVQSESLQTYVTSILSSSTVTANGATLLPGSQVIVLTDSKGNVTIIPVSDPVSKHPDGASNSGTIGGGSEIEVSDLLSLGSLSINSLNALGPVFNAMAGLIHSNLNSDAKRKNDTVITKPVPQISANPLLTYAGPKPPLVRSPIYIPVGGLAADSVAEESQNIEGSHNIFPDVDQRNKPQVILGRPTMESPLLAGGIPISPGQVITANSDVIIGKPSVLGPRPPELKPYVKDEVPIGMQPPPLPKVKPNWPTRDNNGHYIPVNYQTIGPSRLPEHNIRDGSYKIMPEHHGNGLHRPEHPLRDGAVRLSLEQQHHHDLANRIPSEHHHDDHRVPSEQYHGDIPHRMPSEHHHKDHRVPSEQYHGDVPHRIPSEHHQEGHRIPSEHHQEAHRIPSEQYHGDIPHRIPSEHHHEEHIVSSEQYHGDIPQRIASQQYHDIPHRIPLDQHRDIPLRIPTHHIDNAQRNPPQEQYKPHREETYDTIHYNPEQYQTPHQVNQPNRDDYPVYTQPTKQEHENIVSDLRPPSINNKNNYNNEKFVVFQDNKNEVQPRPQNPPQTTNNDIEYVVKHEPISLPDNPEFLDHSTINPLLVNIQPSQVANVIIPHGSSTALIYSGEATQHTQKGEIFNDPSPYPDAEVDHVVDALSTARPAHDGEGITHAAMIPSNAVRFDVPVAPHGINVATGNHAVIQNNPSEINRRPPQLNNQRPQYFQHRPLQNQAGLEYMTPPTPASHNHYHSEDEKPEDDYVIGDGSFETEGGEVIQESNSRPLRPGEVPIELIKNQNQPSTSMPIDTVDDDIESKPQSNKQDIHSHFSRPESGINFSVVNSKPVQLDGLNPTINNPPPIINGRPGTAFDDKSQATVSVGSPTNLKPDSNIHYEEQNIDHNDRPSGNFINPHINEEPSQHDRPVYIKPQFFDNHSDRPNHSNKPVQYDNTVHTMNMDEKPPPIVPALFETRPPKPNFERPIVVSGLDLDTQANTPRPFSVPQPSQVQFDRNSQQEDSVLGLSPPPPATRYETSTRPVVNIGGSRRPSNRVKPRPLPPYKFEVPPPPPKQTTQTKPQRTEPLRIKVPTEVLSPPKPDEESHFDKIPKKPQVTEKNEILKQWLSTTSPRPIITARPESINPILGGVLTVEEIPQKPEVITADSKVVLSNVINGHRVKPDGAIRITGSQPSMQTVVIGKPVPNITPDIIVAPTTVKNTEIPEWQNSILIGSETIIHEEDKSTSTPVDNFKSTKSINPSTIEVTTGVTTIFGNLFTRPVEINKYLKPTKSVQNYHNVISMVVEPDTKTTTEKIKETIDEKEEILGVENSNRDTTIYNPNVIITAAKPTTFVVTHTQTLTVTSTETTVVHSKGKDPSTHTVVLTKTQTSTLLDTVTEIHTLVKPTSVLSTITTTITQSTTTVYPPTSPFDPDNYPFYTQSTDSEKTTEQIITKDPHENESIFVVMTDKKQGPAKIHARPPPEIQVPDETNDISPNVLLGGLLTHPSSDSECRPECKATRNELCQKIDNIMRCVCRPGFARMFPDRPCKPTYTYSIKLVLDHYGKDHIHYSGSLNDSTSSHYQLLSEATREGLDRMVMQSDLRDIYHGVAISGFRPAKKPENAVVKFYVQLSDNTEESRLQDVLRKSLRSNNYSLGGTEVFASKDNIQYLLAEDFDECTDAKFHDCSENAQCFNLRGTYTCSCTEGFTDLSHNALFPGRVCSAEQIGCDQCNYHGTCYSRNENEVTCECFQWYTGEQCQINLKVLLLILTIVGACLMVLLVVCLVLSCIKHRKPTHGGPPPLRPGVGFRRYRGQPTGDKRAMISMDTSSEGSVENTPPPYIKQAVINAQRQKVLRKANKTPAPGTPTMLAHGNVEQRDRSLTVMIPRAKYRPVPVQPTSTLLTMSTFGPEQKLINYLTGDGTHTPDKHGSRSTSRKPSNSTNHSEPVRTRKSSSQSPAPRKPSTGALVSAGFEVSATVGRTKELDESFIGEPHTDLSQQGFNTIRTAESCIIVNIPPPPTLEAELEDIITKVNRLTVSEARSYDETTIQPPTKSIHRDFDSKHSSSHHANNDEGHTMVERDLGSTFMLPQTHLFKNDRGSDISNFDSL